MTFAQRLDEIACLIDARLLALLDELVQGAGGPPTSERLANAMRHATLGGGKRLRPLLVVESARLFGVEPAAALDVGAAIECVHCYSLAHDDLPAMDNDELRRGRPTVWKAFDEWTAILAGDALLTFAFEILSRPGVHPDPQIRLDLISSLARAVGAAGMVGGQALDLEAEKHTSSAPQTMAQIRNLQSMKTGALISLSCEAGAILGAATPTERAALRSYGDALGLAFQIADDLLDVEGDTATVGKRVAKDAAAGKATLLSLMGCEAARAELARVEDQAAAALAIFGARVDMLRQTARFVARRQH